MGDHPTVAELNAQLDVVHALFVVALAATRSGRLVTCRRGRWWSVSLSGMRSSVDVENSHHGLVIVIAYECPQASYGLGARGWVQSLGRSKASAECRG